MRLIQLSLFFSLLFSMSSKLAFSVTFEAKDHCVAWKAKKTMFLLNNLELVGKNCEVSLSFVEKQAGLYALKLEVPLSGFDSGEKERDVYVAERLMAKEDPNLILTSQEQTMEKWEEFFASEEAKLKVELKIGNEKTFPLELSPLVDDAAIVGSVDVDFEKQLGLEPIQVALGVVAKVDPVVELHFHLLKDKIAKP